eukprot:3704916-Rhodomonas_salina.1
MAAHVISPLLRHVSNGRLGTQHHTVGQYRTWRSKRVGGSRSTHSGPVYRIRLRAYYAMSGTDIPYGAMGLGDAR